MLTPFGWPLTPLAVVALAAALAAAAILVWYLVRRPPLDARVRMWLLLGIGVLPITAAMSGNIAGYQQTQERSFCAQCHVMTPYVLDAADPDSATLGSMHSRNRQFGDRSCYLCHADYGLFGAVTTKLNGLRHVWVYHTAYRSGDTASRPLALYHPYPNANCMQCHSTTLPGFADEPEHSVVLDDIRNDVVSCASEGCHSSVHPKQLSGAGEDVH